MNESVIALLNYCVYGAFLVAVAALLFIIVGVVRPNKSLRLDQKPLLRGHVSIRNTIWFGASVMAGLALTQIVSSSSRSRALAFLDTLPQQRTVLINGNTVSNPDELLAILKTLRPAIPHHSHPTKRIRIEVKTANDDLVLELGRDSDRPEEYWVFYPRYPVTTYSEIGRISTPVFSGFGK